MRHYGGAVTISSRVATSLACASAVVAVLALTACSPDEEVAQTGCASTVHEASLAAEVSDQIRLLDLAMVRCASLSELSGEMSRYPGITGYDVPTFVQLRCTKVSDEAVLNSPACASVTATTAAPVTAP